MTRRFTDAGGRGLYALQRAAEGCWSHYLEAEALALVALGLTRACFRLEIVKSSVCIPTAIERTQIRTDMIYRMRMQRAKWPYW